MNNQVVPYTGPGLHIDVSGLDKSGRAGARRLMKAQADAAFQSDMINLVREVLVHPVYSLVFGYTFIEYMQKKDIVGNISGTAVETALFSKTALEALSSSGVLDALLPILAGAFAK